MIVTPLAPAHQSLLDRRAKPKDRQLTQNTKGTRSFLTLDPSYLPKCSWAKRTKGKQVCKGWKCPVCCLRRGHEEAAFVYRKLRWAASEGVPVLSVTLTDPSSVGRPMTLARFRKAFDLWKTELRKFQLRAAGYYATLGFNPITGRLHLHVLLFGLAFIPLGALRRAAEKAKLGHSIIKEVLPVCADHKRRANYFAENAVSYAEAHRFYSSRIQPVSPRNVAPQEVAMKSKKSTKTVITNPAASKLPKPLGDFADSPEKPAKIRPKVPRKSRVITEVRGVVQVTNPAGADRA